MDFKASGTWAAVYLASSSLRREQEGIWKEAKDETLLWGRGVDALCLAFETNHFLHHYMKSRSPSILRAGSL